MYKLSPILIAGLAMLQLTGSVQAASREDPLRPPDYSKSPVMPKTMNKTWYVNEILASEGRRLAIVNNRMVKAGDSVDGAKVLDISPDRVTLKYENRIIYSPLNLVPVKRLIKPGVGH